MAKGNLAACLPVTLAYEGGWADHPKDPGGATMKGVTLAVYRKYRPGASKADLRAISDKEIQNIYRDGYWTPVRGDDLPYGVDLVVFDFGVNSGPSRAAKYLQSVAGVAQDGKIGSGTVKAVNGMVGKTVIQKFCAKRLGFVQGLSTFKVFGKGWSRRIADVEAKAVAMWLRYATTAAPDRQKEILRGEAEQAGKTAQQQGKAGGTAAGGGAVVSGGDAALNGAGWVAAAVLVAAVAIAVVVLVKARQNKHRAEAYATAAAAV